MLLLAYVLVGLYLCALFLSFLYGVNAYILVYLHRRHAARRLAEDQDTIRRFWKNPPPSLPVITVQLPLFNERYVVTRLLRAVTALDYPRDRLEIQVLDDSTDDTTARAAAEVERLRAEGWDITLVHRRERTGYKAGALKEGLARARGEFVALFDADFVPHPRVLRDTLPFFADPRVAMVQTRWGHLNAEYSPLTRAQAIGIDGHFGIEQAARNWSGLFMNFNGSGGVWRVAAISDAGGWHTDTLTEDLDLSYRALLAGWRMTFVQHLVSPGEIPIDINAYKAQQRRWATGSLQVARKILPLLWRAPLPVWTKYQATIHLTHYAVHALMIAVALLTVPLLYLQVLFTSLHSLLAVTMLFSLATFGPSTLYLFSQRVLSRDWIRQLPYFPIMMLVGTGISVSNTVAVVRAFRGGSGEFVRTPKWNVTGRGGAREAAAYRVPLAGGVAAEFVMAAYCLWGLVIFLVTGRYIISPFYVIYTLGFVSVGTLTLHHSLARGGAVRALGWLGAAARTHAPALALITVAIALRAVRLPSLDPFEDSYHHWFLAARGTIEPRSLWSSGLPLYHAMGAVVLSLTGLWNLPALKLVNIALSAGTMTFVYGLARGARWGLWAMAFVALNPVDILTASMAVPAPLATFLLILAVVLVERRQQTALPALLLGMAALTTAEAWPFCLFVAAVIVDRAWGRRRATVPLPAAVLDASYPAGGTGAPGGGSVRLAPVGGVAWPAVASMVLLAAWQYATAAPAADAGVEPYRELLLLGLVRDGASDAMRVVVFARSLFLTGLPLFLAWLLAARTERRDPFWVMPAIGLLLVFAYNPYGMYAGNHRYIALVLPFLAVPAAKWVAARGRAVGAAVAAVLALTVAYHADLYAKFSEFTRPLAVAGRTLGAGGGPIVCDAPEVAFFSRLSPRDILRSADLPLPTRRTTLETFRAWGVTRLVWVDHPYLRLTQLFPDLALGQDTEDLVVIADPYAGAPVPGAKRVFIYALRPTDP